MITIYDLVNLYTVPEEIMVDIYDCATNKILFKGEYKDMPTNLDILEIVSIDNPEDRVIGVSPYICINVDTAK